MPADAEKLAHGKLVREEAAQKLALHVSDLISAYVANNPLPPAELPALIASVHATLQRLSVTAGAETTDKAATAVPRPSSAEIRRSIGRDGLTSFIDGRVYKTLKRHLTSHGLDPVAYRQRYGLPDDYPMVAPSYAERRSALAKEIGLGRPGALAARQTNRSAA